MSELLGRYALDRWDADGAERDGGAHAQIIRAGPIRTQLRIVSAHPERWRLPIAYRESDFWPVNAEAEAGL
jgi:hypothetical protein